jgi:tRNA-modifying protein YgfZ
MRARIESFAPAYGRDFGARSFPQEARLERAVSFTKGCYLGQEIVARIQSRGAVNRLLVQLVCAGPVAEGDAIARDGSNVGSVTSAAARPGGDWIALAIVKKEHAAPGTELQIGSAGAHVVGPTL